MTNNLDFNLNYTLYSNCLLDRGFQRGIIIDLQRNEVFTIPIDLYKIISAQSEKTINEWLEICESNESKAILIEYFQYLYDEELIFPLSHIRNETFVELNRHWEDFSSVSNCVLYYFEKQNCEALYSSLLESLNNMLCRAMQYVNLEKFNLFDLTQFLECLKLSTITHIEIVLNYTEELKNRDFLVELSEKYTRIKSISIYNSLINDSFVCNESGCVINYNNKIVLNEKSCGSICSEQLTINIPHYTESLAHNTCLNRKIAIDAEGNIKNCPSMKESFGNIKDTTLEEAINKPGFKKYWNIKKDDITKCKDCEFRHVCTDCRAYIENPEDIYSAPLKCGYDPYTCEWEEWSTNPLKQKAIDFYGFFNEK